MDIDPFYLLTQIASLYLFKWIDYENCSVFSRRWGLVLYAEFAFTFLFAESRPNSVPTQPSPKEPNFPPTKYATFSVSALRSRILPTTANTIRRKIAALWRAYSTKSICSPSAASTYEAHISSQTHLDQMRSWSCDTHVTCVSLTGAFVPIICRFKRDKDSRLAKRVAKQLTKILRCNQSETHSAGPRTYLVPIFF